MGWFIKKERKSANEMDVYPWPLNKYPKWLLDVINSNAQADFEAAYPQNVEKVGFAKWVHGKPLTWETAPSNWRRVFRERAVMSVRWIEEYEDYNNGY